MLTHTHFSSALSPKQNKVGQLGPPLSPSFKGHILRLLMQAVSYVISASLLLLFPLTSPNTTSQQNTWVLPELLLPMKRKNHVSRTHINRYSVLWFKQHIWEPKHFWSGPDRQITNLNPLIIQMRGQTPNVKEFVKRKSPRLLVEMGQEQKDLINLSFTNLSINHTACCTYL